MTRSPVEKEKTRIFAKLKRQKPPVLMLKDLRELLSANRQRWKLGATTADEFVSFLLEKGELRAWKFDFPYRPETRYTWGDLSPFQVIATLRPDAYFSHYTALSYHGLTEQIPKTAYLNSEQPLKRGGSMSGSLEQVRIDRAFRGKPRRSSNSTTIGGLSICLISGKNTGKLGVITAQAGDLRGLPVTDLERTILDATVRPFYAGGPLAVLRAYENAKEHLSANRLAQLLTKIDLIYPYHQSIGLYLEMAGYPEKAFEPFLKMERRYDFCLDYQMSKPQYSPNWRIYFPKDLKAARN